MTNAYDDLEFIAVVGDSEIPATLHVTDDEDIRLDLVIGTPSGSVYAAVAGNQFSQVDGATEMAYYAVTCDHRVEPAAPGLILAGDLAFGPEDLSLSELEDGHLVDLAGRLLSAIHAGKAIVPGADAAFPGAFSVEARVVKGELGSADFVAKFPSDEAIDSIDDEAGEVGRSWNSNCPILVRAVLDGHHLTWTVDDTDAVPGEGSGYMTGWATFAGGIGLTTFRDMEFAIPPYLCFRADAPPQEGSDRATWRVAWAYAALTVGGLTPDVSIARDVR